MSIVDQLRIPKKPERAQSRNGYELAKMLLESPDGYLVVADPSVGNNDCKWSRFVEKFIVPRDDEADDAWQTEIIEACVAQIAYGSKEASHRALTTLQHAPLDASRKEHAISALADVYIQVHSQRPNDETAKVLEDISHAFYSVGEYYQAEYIETTLPFCIETVRSRYDTAEKSRLKSEVKALESLSRLETEAGTFEVLPKMARGDRKAIVMRNGQIATSIVLGAAVAAGPVAAHAETGQRLPAEGGGLGTAKTSISRSINSTEAPLMTPLEGSVDVVVRFDVQSLGKSEPMSADQIVNIDHTTTADVVAATKTVSSAKNKVTSADIINAANFDGNKLSVNVATYSDPLPEELTPTEQIERRMFEQMGVRTNQGGAEPKDRSDKEVRATEALKEQIQDLQDRIRVAAEQRRVSPSTSEVSKKLHRFLETAVDDPSVLQMLTPTERRAILDSQAFGGDQYIEAFLEDIPDSSPVMQWVRSVESKSESGKKISDGAVAMMLYSGLYTSTLSKTEADALLGYKPIIPDKYVDTRIDGIEAVDLSNIDVKAAEMLSERGDNPEPNTTDWVNRGKAMKFFIEHGLTPIQAAGLIGNFVVESGDDSLPPGIHQIGGGPGRGIVQWEISTNGGSGRADQLFWFADQIGQPWDSLDTQLKFIIWEFENTEKPAYKKLKQADTLEEATSVVLNFYERPAERIVDVRLSWAEKTYAGFIEEREALERDGMAGASQNERINNLIAQGFTQQTKNKLGVEEMVPVMHGDFNYMSQNAIRLKEKLIERGYDGDLGSKHMCGLVSIFMAKHAAIGETWTKAGMDAMYDELLEHYDWSLKNEVFAGGQGGPIWHAKIPELAKEMGLQTIPLQAQTEEEIRVAFDNGATAIVLNSNADKAKVNGAEVSSYGHVFVIVGITENNTLIIADPDSYENSMREWTFGQLLKNADLSAMHVMSAPGDLDRYQDVINDRAEAAEREKREAEREKREAERKAEQERKEKEREKREAEREAEREERDRQRKAEKARQSGAWDPTTMPDGWVEYQKLKAKYPVSGTLPMSELVVPVPGLYEKMGDKQEVMLTPSAAAAFADLNAAFVERYGRNLPVNDSYRSYDSQVITKRESPELAAPAGESPHGYVGIDIEVGHRGSEIYNFLIEEGPSRGIFNPVWMDPNGINNSGFYTMDEPWHFEYFGNAANIERLVGGHSDYDMKAVNKALGN